MMLTVVEEALSYDLTTLDTAKAELQITGSADDAAIMRLIRQASAACARACGRPHFARELYEQSVEYCDPADFGGGAVILDRDLEAEIVSVAVNGEALAAGNWRLEHGILRRVFPAYAWGAVTVRYFAGFELLGTLPDDIERACLVTMRAWHMGRDRDPAIRVAQTEGVGSTTYGTAATAGGVTIEAAGLLAPWRRIRAF